MKMNLTQAHAAIVRGIRNHLVPFVVGSPAVGKSAIVHQIAKEYALKVIDVRLAQCDPCDLLGFPQLDRDTGKAYYAPMDTFPIQGDKVPEGYNGWLIFLDELTSAPRAVQAAAYKLVLDKMVGNHRLHDKVVVVAAGNLETDNAIVEPMSSALKSRLMHLEVQLDQEVWLEWAVKAGIDHRILSYIRFKPDMLYTFNPESSDDTYGSPRTWEFASRLIRDQEKVTSDDLHVLAGCVSEGLAREFIGFCSIYSNLLTVEQICRDPEGVPVPTSPSELYALSGSLGNHAKPENIELLIKFIQRMPIEFNIITLRDATKRTPELRKTAALQQWIATQARELF